MLSLQEP